MSRDPIPSWYFAMVVVCKEDEFLLVQEAKHGQEWYFPAGRVEQGERLVDGARREVLEESGVRVRLTGILRIEHSPRAFGTRQRIFFTAEPLDDSPPKQTPDEHAIQAKWVRLEDLDRYPLRGEEVREAFQAVAGG
ncbi:MAG: NUDIX domain-containing protein [Planctomycetales bacterium]